MTATYPNPVPPREPVEHSRTIVAEVLIERLAQVANHNHSRDVDDAYVDRELARASGAYALSAAGQSSGSLFWPWPGIQWNEEDPRRCLLKAAALAVAEIERLDRAAEMAIEGAR